MKVVKSIMIIIFCFLIIGCKDKDAVKVINKKYIETNDGVLFDKFAIALDENKNQKNNYALFVKKNNDRYEKIDILSEYKNDSEILYTNKYIYLFEKNGSFVGYKVDIKSKKLKKYEPSFDIIDGLIYFPKEVYGFDDNYIYISYFLDSKKTELLYAKIKYDLSSYVSIDKKDLLEKYEYNIIKK